MSTPTSAPKGDEPFDPKAMPGDLVAAQHTLHGLYAALRAHQATLPWAREADPGWEAEKKERGRERAGREKTTGWEADDAATFDGLLEEIREVAAFVQSHSWWANFTGADLVDARQALKRAPGAIHVRPEDLETAA